MTRSVQTSMRFLADIPLYGKEKPYELWLDDIPEGVPRTNVMYDHIKGITVKDMRAYDELSLDTTGFLFLHHESQYLPSFDTPDVPGPMHLSSLRDEKVLDAFLEETANLVKDFLNANEVLVQDWRHRKDTTESALEDGPIAVIGTDRLQTLKPAVNVHLDDSNAGARRRLKRVLTSEESKKYINDNWRIRMINVWRPLNPIVRRDPLALCDKRSMAPRDVVSVDKVHDTFTNEGLYVQHNAAQSWYYLADQTLAEPLMFVTWDSDKSDFCPGPPHASFLDPKCPPEAPVRESIEVRTIAFTRVA